MDWSNLGINWIWIAGLALGLATLGYAAAQSVMRGEKLRDRLKLRGYQAGFMAAASLFSLGMGLTARNTWEMILWFALAGLFAIQVAGAIGSSD
jgi:hypothetical protein